MLKVVPLILAGGSGSRLWPVSRKSYPKQFSNLIGDKSLFQSAALRLCSSSCVEFDQHITITNDEYRFIVCEQLQSVGIDPGPILIEPEGRNTAPAILAASIFAMKSDEDTIILAAPSDHMIPDKDEFHKIINAGLPQAFSGKIVTFGVEPTRAETGYGYLKTKKTLDPSYLSVEQFIEKPDQEKAVKMLDEGDYLWNSGIFLFKAKKIVESFRYYYPSLLDPVSMSVDCATEDLGFLRLNKDHWKRCENISIDYAIMEHTKDLVAVSFSKLWSDLGSWESVFKEMNKNQDGVIVSDNAHAIDCKNTMLRSENKNQELVGIGLDEIIAISMNDAVLVADRRMSQNVKEVVSLLKSKGVSQADSFPKDHRPWGWFETLALQQQFQVKRIFVNPGAALSLQSHKHRSEHWVVVEGRAKVTVDERVEFLAEGQSIYIPLGAIHRLENLEKFPMIIIEVQTGSYLGEDDIMRYDDLYKRS